MNIHLKTAISHIKRAPFQATSAMFVLALTFFVMTLVSVLTYSSGKIIKHFETRPQVIAFLKDDIPVDAISAMQNKLEDDMRVRDVSYVSKEEALSIYKEATADNPLLSELVSPSIFPASLEFSLTDLSKAQEVIDEVKNEGIVEEVGFTASLGGESTLEDVVSRLKTVTYYIKLGGGIFAGVLMITSLLVLLVIISMRMTTRRQEIEVLSLIGATSGFIRSPILLEAIIYSVFGVIFGWMTMLLLTLYLTPSVIKYFADIPVLPKDTVQLLGLFGIILVGEIVIGVLLALTGSVLAVSRARRNK